MWLPTEIGLSSLEGTPGGLLGTWSVSLDMVLITQECSMTPQVTVGELGMLERGLRFSDKSQINQDIFEKRVPEDQAQGQLG